MRREYPPFYQSTSGKHVPPGTTPLECFGINGCTRKPVIQNKSSTLREGWIGNSRFNKCTDLNWNDPLLSSNVGSAEIEEDSIEFCSGCKRKKLYCKNIYITSISLFHRLFIIHVKSWQWRIVELLWVFVWWRNLTLLRVRVLWSLHLHSGLFEREPVVAWWVRHFFLYWLFSLSACLGSCTLVVSSWYLSSQLYHIIISGLDSRFSHDRSPKFKFPKK